jgi:flagellar hook assembly protein FlgD
LTANASSPVTVHGDVQVTVSIYNEAGEVVKTFPVKYLSNPVDDLELSPGSVITTVGGSVTMTWGGGRVLGTWDGTGGNGQLVANGSYFVKVDSVDPYGTTTSVTKPLTVNRRVVTLAITIYNDAGEVVRHLYQTQPATDSAVTDVTLSTTVIHPGGDGKDGISPTVGIVLSNGVATVWDGTSDSGGNVQDGSYFIHLKVENASNGTVEITKPISVLDSRANTGNTGVWPNVVTSDNPKVALHAAKLGSDQLIHATLFTIAGSKAGQVEGLVGQNDVTWDLSGYASGLYIVVMDTRENGLLKDRTKLKLIVRK